MIFILIIQYTDFEGKEITPFIVMPGTPQEKKLEPITACLFSILLSFTFYFVMGLGRLSIRTATRCEQLGAEETQSLLKNKFIDLLSIYMILVYIGFFIWAFIAYWITDSKFFPIWGTTGSGCILCFLRAYIYFCMNDFEYFQDVEKLNAFIDRHNKKIDENEKKKQ